MDRNYKFYFDYLCEDGGKCSLEFDFEQTRELFYSLLKVLYLDYLIQTPEPSPEKFMVCILENLESHVNEIGSSDEKIALIKKMFDDMGNGRVNMWSPDDDPLPPDNPTI